MQNELFKLTYFNKFENQDIDEFGTLETLVKTIKGFQTTKQDFYVTLTAYETGYNIYFEFVENTYQIEIFRDADLHMLAWLSGDVVGFISDTNVEELHLIAYLFASIPADILS